MLESRQEVVVTISISLGGRDGPRRELNCLVEVGVLARLPEAGVQRGGDMGQPLGQCQRLAGLVDGLHQVVDVVECLELTP
jgi:hypothetical protein